MNYGPKTGPAPMPSPAQNGPFAVAGNRAGCAIWSAYRTGKNRLPAMKPPGPHESEVRHPVAARAPDYTVYSMANLDSGWKESWLTRTLKITTASGRRKP
jgi:hypothetical protein